MSARFNQFFLAGLLGGAAYVAAAILGPDLVAVGLDASLLSWVPVPAWYAIAGAILGLVIGAEIDRFRQRRGLDEDIRILNIKTQELHRQLMPTIKDRIKAIAVGQTATVGEIQTKLEMELGLEDALYIEFRRNDRNVMDNMKIKYVGVVIQDALRISHISDAIENAYDDQFDGDLEIVIRDRGGKSVAKQKQIAKAKADSMAMT